LDLLRFLIFYLGAFSLYNAPRPTDPPAHIQQLRARPADRCWTHYPHPPICPTFFLSSED
jgi:hypothetical protein